MSTIITWKIKDIEAVLPLLDDTKFYKLSEIKESRSLRQNSYLHLIFDAIAKDMWDEPVYVKELLKWKFLQKKMQGKSTKIITYIKSTSNLNKKEFAEFIKSIQFWAWEWLKITIPNPDDIKLVQFAKEYKLN